MCPVEGVNPKVYVEAMRNIIALAIAAAIAASPVVAADKKATPNTDAYFACIVGTGANAIRHGSDSFSALVIADEACEPLGKLADKEVGVDAASRVMQSAFSLVNEIGKLPRS